MRAREFDVWFGVRGVAPDLSARPAKKNIGLEKKHWFLYVWCPGGKIRLLQICPPAQKEHFDSYMFSYLFQRMLFLGRSGERTNKKHWFPYPSGILGQRTNKKHLHFQPSRILSARGHQTTHQIPVPLISLMNMERRLPESHRSLRNHIRIPLRKSLVNS